MKRKISVLFVSFFTLIFFLGIPTPVHAASLLDNLVSGVKNFISPPPTNHQQTSNTAINFSFANPPNNSGKLTLDSKITLAKNGDFNKDGNIEGGNMVTFSYIINNDTNTDYRFVTLNTNIPRNLLYYFQNMKGVFSMEEKNGSMDIPNIFIPAHHQLNISFDAHVLYFSDGDKTLGTHAQLIDQNGQNLAEAKEFDVKAKSLAADKFKGFNTLVRTK